MPLHDRAETRSETAGTQPSVDHTGDTSAHSGSVMELHFHKEWDSNLVLPRPLRVLPVDMIKSQVKHPISAPVQRRLLKVFHCFFVVVQYNPMVPAQTIQGVN